MVLIVRQKLGGKKKESEAQQYETKKEITCLSKQGNLTKERKMLKK